MAQRRRSRRLMGEINVVPYIDVMLVLLIIFMVTAPLLTQGVKVNLPEAGAEPLPPHKNPNDKPLILSIDAKGSLYLNIGAEPAVPIDDQVLLQRAAAVLRETPEVEVLVKGDSAVPYGRVISAMVVLQRAGARKVGFLTDPLPNAQVSRQP